VSAIGFDGTVNEDLIAQIIGQLTAPAIAAGAWKVTPVTNQRAVTVGGGRGAAAFVLSTAAPAVLQLAPPVTARYDLISRRINWETNTDEWVVIQGPSSSTTIPTQPIALSAFTAVARNPGTLLDIPVAVTWVDASNVVRVFDVRTLPPTGRGHLLVPPLTAAWTGDEASWTSAYRVLEQIEIPDPGMPYRLSFDIRCEVGGTTRGARYDLEVGTGYGGPAVFDSPIVNILDQVRGFDQFDNNVTQQRANLGTPSPRIYYGPTRIAAQATRKSAGGTGLITATGRSFTVGIWAA
jgi:hypothetical protein